MEGRPSITAIRERDPKLINVIVEKLTKTLSEKFGTEPMKCQLQAIVVEAEK